MEPKNVETTHTHTKWWWLHNSVNMLKNWFYIFKQVNFIKLLKKKKSKGSMQRGPPPRTWWVQMPPWPLRHRPCPPNSLWNWGSMCLCSFTHRHIPDTTPAPSYQMPVMFTSPRVSMRWVLFYGWENTGSERFSTMPTVTQLVSDTAGIWTHQGRGTNLPAFLPGGSSILGLRV